MSSLIMEHTDWDTSYLNQMIILNKSIDNLIRIGKRFNQDIMSTGDDMLKQPSPQIRQPSCAIKILPPLNIKGEYVQKLPSLVYSRILKSYGIRILPSLDIKGECVIETPSSLATCSIQVQPQLNIKRECDIQKLPSFALESINGHQPSPMENVKFYEVVYKAPTKSATYYNENIIGQEDLVKINNDTKFEIDRKLNINSRKHNLIRGKKINPIVPRLLVRRKRQSYNDPDSSSGEGNISQNDTLRSTGIQGSPVNHIVCSPSKASLNSDDDF